MRKPNIPERVNGKQSVGKGERRKLGKIQMVKNTKTQPHPSESASPEDKTGFKKSIQFKKKLVRKSRQGSCCQR